jgi:hypothetical protein
MFTFALTVIMSFRRMAGDAMSAAMSDVNARMSGPAVCDHPAKGD